MKHILCAAITCCVATSAGAATLHRDVDGHSCHGETDAELLDQAREALHSSGLKKWVKVLHDQGDAGCQVLADWLATGVRGKPAARAEAVDLLLNQEGTPHLATVMSLIAYEGTAAGAPLMRSLQERLVHLTDEEVDTILALSTDETREHAVWMMAGYHCNELPEVVVEHNTSPFGGAVTIEIEYPDPDDIECHGQVPVPPCHVRGLQQLARDDDDDVREAVARAAGPALLLGFGPSVATWGQLLEQLAGDDEEDVQVRVAYSLGLGTPPGVQELIENLHEQGEDEDDISRHYVRGLRVRYLFKGVDPALEDLARWAVKEFDGPEKQAAVILLGKIEKDPGR